MKVKFIDIFSDETKRGCKIQTNEYSLTGKYPIIDQGQEQIAGYTNLEDGIFCDVPVIVFGDHTRIVKYIETPFFLGADGVKVLKSKLCNTDYKYLFYWLSNANIPNTGYNRHFKWLKELEINLPSLDEQRHIAAILDKVSDLIALRKKQLAKLDELVKARFVEMFGNEEDFYSTQLYNSVEEMFIGPFGSSLKNDCFVPKKQGFCMVYEQKHAIRKTLDVETRYVNEKKFQELKRFSVYGGDIIVSCRGTIGETYIVPECAPLGIMHPSIMKIRLKMNVYDKAFFNQLLQNFLKKYNDKVNGSGVKMAITAKMLGEQEFILPPLELQKQFANFVEVVEKQKKIIQRSLEKLEILKKSLMQEYFG